MDENTILTLAKATLLSKEEVQMWVDHLSCLAKHRQAGAKKAAKSRAKRAQQKLYCFCQKTDDKRQAMIACDNPSCKFEWFHFQCVGLQEEEDLVGQWFCPSCTLAR